MKKYILNFKNQTLMLLSGTLMFLLSPIAAVAAVTGPYDNSGAGPTGYDSAAGGGVGQTSSAGDPTSFAGLVDVFLGILSLIVPLIFSLALLIIVWKIIDAWIINAGDPGKRDEGKQYATWGILILVVMSGIWAILRILRSSLFY